MALAMICFTVRCARNVIASDDPKFVEGKGKALLNSFARLVRLTLNVIKIIRGRRQAMNYSLCCF